MCSRACFTRERAPTGRYKQVRNRDGGHMWTTSVDDEWTLVQQNHGPFISKAEHDAL